MNIFFKAQFNYCSLVWMLHSCKLNNKINRLHKRCFRIIYNHNLGTFNELLESDNSVSNYIKNLQCLAIFPLNESSIYDNRNRQTCYTRPVKSVYKGTESSLSFFGL